MLKTLATNLLHVIDRILLYLGATPLSRKYFRHRQGTNARKVISEMYTFFVLQSPKFKRVSVNKPPGFPFCGLIICVDFDLRD